MSVIDPKWTSAEAGLSATQAQFPFLDFIYTSTYSDVALGGGEAMRRRKFITLLSGVAAAWPLAAHAEQAERARHIGILMILPEDDPASKLRIAAFFHGLQQLNWTVGQNVKNDIRRGAADPTGARKGAAELVALAPDVILATGRPSTAALQAATHTLPIVFVNVADPVGAGYVASLARPGGNA